MAAPPLHSPPALRVVLLTALAYVAVGMLAVLLAGPPGYAAPLYPSAGIALAALMAYGRAAAVGVLLGAFVVNLGLGAMRGVGGHLLISLPLLIGVGASLQAWVGAALVKRFVGTDAVLSAPRDIALAGFFGALLACLVSPSIATPALVLTGTVARADALGTWLTWWTGDALGVLIAAPLVLTLIGRPAADWRPRRRTLALPLTLALVLLSAAMLETARLDEARRRVVIEREADRLAAETRARLNAALHALQALRGAAGADGNVDGNVLRAASRWWLAQPLHLQAMGFSPRVAGERIAAVEAAAQAQGLNGYRIFDRDGGRDRAVRGEVLPVREIEPRDDNRGALGVNAWSVPEALQALLTARDSGEPAATAAFTLSQLPQSGAGVVLYQALYSGQPQTLAQRQAQFSGVVFVTLRTERALADLSPQERSFLQWCLKDVASAGGPQRWAGPPGCETSSAAEGQPALERSLNWAGRQLVLTMRADSSAVPSERETTWLLVLAAMAASALLGALLLTVTGQQRRTQLAVRAGTKTLRGEAAERKRTEAALRESGERLRSILDNVPLGVMFLDPEGRLIECNLQFTQMVGMSMQALLGRSVAELVHPDDALHMRRLRRELLQGQAGASIDGVRLLPTTGAAAGITVRVRTSALRGADGQMLRMVGVVEDTTEHLRLLGSERALQQAEAANRAKSDFLSRMSHELRTPLNAMIGFSQLLGLDRNPELVPHQRDWTQQIQRAGWHLLEMINETLDLARIESGAVQLTLTPLDVPSMVAACRAMLAGPAAQRGVQIEERLGANAATVLGDATRVKQVLTNLLSNAVKYNREGGAVHVTSRLTAAGQVEIAVTDTGLGMSDTQVQGLFQPYNRLGREKSGIEGTGIGLVISRRLTELMGGTMGVTSTAGAGSSFIITLPATAPTEHPAPRNSESTPAPYQQRLVHYVEDNDTNIEVMRGVLAQRPQVLLRTSQLGLDGLAAIRRERPDLILLDMHLPDISGLELLRHLKQDVEVAEIPVIVVSADATPGQIAQALTLGAVQYVTKPLDVATFLPLVDNALEEVDTRWGM
ncbi:MAG: CHASE domain-containing protein [Rubrivivax sp.]|nr:CHASE domain-containing protein [Rubrivivax sp.]